MTVKKGNMTEKKKSKKKKRKKKRRRREDAKVNSGKLAPSLIQFCCIYFV
jgi:hypothetical protein